MCVGVDAVFTFVEASSSRRPCRVLLSFPIDTQAAGGRAVMCVVFLFIRLDAARFLSLGHVIFVPSLAYILFSFSYCFAHLNDLVYKRF